MPKEVSQQKAAVLGLQHLLAMYSGAVAVPLLIGGALKFNSTQMTYLVSIDIFMCGLATLLQLMRNKYFGIGLPVVLGCAIQAVAPLVMIGKKFSINTMYGAIIVAGIFVFLIAGFFSKIKKLFPPVVTGTLITTIGLTLIPVAFQNMGGGNSNAKNFGDSKNLIVSFITIAIIIALEIWAKGFLKSISVLVGLILGTIIASFMGLVSLKPVIQASWFHLPQFFYFGVPKFEWSSSLTMIIIALVSMVESTGVFFATGDLLHKNISEDDLKRGYRAEGLAQILGGLFNTFPYTTFSQNVGLLQLSGIKTKRPIYWAASLLMLMGLLPKVGALVTIIPTPVLGGAMLVMFTMIAVQGIKMLLQTNLNDNRNVLTIAISIGLGLGVTIYPKIFQNLPQTVQLFLSNGIVVASLSATLLNLLFKKGSGEK
ncbi:nucleobase:cation symporter-2 family protein [Lactobacillus acetotolerans]|uniref:Purine permease n=2 Tax=Lactobacillus acetotolerans TaxID=1600 RepID=A0A0D6A1M6_9LACO|nr:nucleobase:cation symporter-2 family protein [Lactobacillus acetotolerans]KRN40273.1 xanthine permease [Lactobacillus acetotolerans DSM 20749 = JCM 3825]QFG50811.1 purine permease [Lactobacillus acetotolerans]QGV05078.1 purine permease [Lactobacillus acetotolerans]QJD72587.1 purine permease [Lactobacillus acetotolerans]BAQ56702.1 xanthine permease [Lactobacillus acetotolerans]